MQTLTAVSYGTIHEAHQILIAATPSGLPTPSTKVIRRAAERGAIRTIKVGCRYVFHLGDVANLVAINGGAR